MPTSTTVTAHSGTRAPVIVARDVHVSFGTRHVLQGINVTIDPATFVSIVGPNGAGKTTLLRALLGTCPATGEVSVCGDSSRRRLDHIGYVPQRHNIDWDYPLDVAHMVATGLIKGRFPRIGTSTAQWAAVAEALEKVGIKHLHDRPIADLSGGQRQRVLLARALVKKPSILALDEPNTGLDMPGEHALMETCRQLVDQGTTVVMTTHDIGGAMDRSDKILLLKETVRAFSAPAELKDPQVWMETFDIPADHHLLRTVGVTTAPPAGFNQKHTAHCVPHLSTLDTRSTRPGKASHD